MDPDNWAIDKALIDRPGVDEIMLDLLYDIRNNVPTFKAMQEFVRDRRPPTLVATGGNDEIFPEEIVRQILTDHPAAEYHALDTGHFALEDKADEIAGQLDAPQAWSGHQPAALGRPAASPTKGWLFALCTGGYERGPPGMTIVWMRRANEHRLNPKEG